MPLSPEWNDRNEKAEVIWRWTLRVAALVAFAYILVKLKGDVPLGVFILIGGFAGVGNVVSWSSVADTFMSKRKGGGE